MMKKFLIFTVSFFVLSTFLIAQKNNTVSAYNAWKKGKLDTAKEYIDKSSAHEKTMTDPKTWCYRGHIYLEIAKSKVPAYEDLAPDALDQAFEAYQNCIKYDSKNRWTDEAKSQIPAIGQNFFNKGANKYNEGREVLEKHGDTLLATGIFNKSVLNFDKAYMVAQELGEVDTLALYYASISAELAGNKEVAIDKLEKLIEIKYEKPDIFISLANIYYNQGNVDKAIATYATGKEWFPNNVNILLNEINVYLKEGEIDKAISGLEKAVELDPENPTVHFAIGAKYNEFADDEEKELEVRKEFEQKAVDAYKNAISLKEDYFEPSYNLGAIYVNKASAVIAEANALDLSEQEEYDALMLIANGHLEEALPYLEKAHELNPDDISTMSSLKEIYTRLKMYDKLKVINEKMK